MQADLVLGKADLAGIVYHKWVPNALNILYLKMLPAKSHDAPLPIGPPTQAEHWNLAMALCTLNKYLKESEFKYFTKRNEHDIGKL